MSIPSHRRFAQFAALCILLIAPNVYATDAKNLVTAKLLADVSTVAPGQTFTVGVLYTIKPEWHIYWKNAGDNGLPTLLKFKAPDGFTVGELRWPAPVEFAQPGNIAAYGYTESVLLMAKITAPKTLSPGAEITIEANTEWLCCEKVCIPGNADLKLKLTAAESTAPANSELFKEWDDHVPVTMESSAIASAKIDGKLSATEPSPFKIELDWKAAPQSVEWFADTSPGLYIDQLEIKTRDSHTRISFSARRLKGLDVKDILPGVITYRDKQGKRHGVEMTVPLNPEPLKP